MKPVRLSFVCLGNICRSPTAEAVMRHLIKKEGLEKKVLLDSAGLGDWHVGEARDSRNLYLTMTGRICDQVPNLVIKGASSAGKSNLVKKVLPNS